MRFTQAQVDAFNARRLQSGARVGGIHAVESEADLHEQIFAECRRRGWIAFHGSMSERTHRTLGEPDFIILAGEGRQFLVECKSRTGKLSPEQTAIARHAAMLGHRIHVVRSFGEFLEVINERGAL